METNVDEFTLGLARHLCAAALAYQMGISFTTAMRDYVMKQETIGALWLEIAQQIKSSWPGTNRG